MKKHDQKIKAIRRTVAGWRPFLEPNQIWKKLSEDDLADFKHRYRPNGKTAHQRCRRADVLRCFGKPPEKLTLNEFKDYWKPSFHAQYFLGTLWPQLTTNEQEIVKRLSEWAFLFGATFTTNLEYREACAGRLERFFGRCFHAK